MYPRTALRSSLSAVVLGLVTALAIPAAGTGQVPGPRPRRTQPPPDQTPQQEPLQPPDTELPPQEPLVKPDTDVPPQEPLLAPAEQPSSSEPEPAPGDDGSESSTAPASGSETAPASDEPETTPEPAATRQPDPVPEPPIEMTGPVPTPRETTRPAETAPSEVTSMQPAPASDRVTVVDSSSALAPVGVPAGTADGGLPRRVRLGVTFAESQSGMVVRAVAPRSAAASAGLREGDVLVAINATPVANADALSNRLQFLRPGEPVTVAIDRSGETVDVQIVPDEAAREGDLQAKVEYSAFAGTKGKLRSIWSIPKGASSPRPAVLIVRGVGASPADAPGNNPFRELAFQLARAGFITVRYDPEGVGDSQGLPNAAVDFDAEVADARAALEHLRQDPRVDPARITVIGQGTGGGVAAVLVAQDGKVAGLGVVGMIARPLMEYLLDSRRQQMALAGVPPGEIDDILHEHIAIYASLLGSGRIPTSDPYGIVSPDGTLMGKTAAFWREYDKVNYSKLFEDLKVPVLNAIGEYDYVSTLADHRAIADALKARGEQGQVLVVLGGSDHDLRSFDSRESAFAAYGSTSAPINDRAVATIVEWVRSESAGAATAQ